MLWRLAVKTGNISSLCHRPQIVQERSKLRSCFADYDLVPSSASDFFGQPDSLQLGQHLQVHVHGCLAIAILHESILKVVVTIRSHEVVEVVVAAAAAAEDRWSPLWSTSTACM